MPNLTKPFVINPELVWVFGDCLCKQEVVEEKSEWKKKWQTQLSGLKKRSHQKENNSMSWAARMRRQQHVSEDSSS